MVPNNYAAQDGGVRIDEGSENCFKIVNQNGIDLCGVFVLLIEPAVDRVGTKCVYFRCAG